MNTWHGIGNLTKDPEIRYTQSGVAVANFTLAIDAPPSKEGKAVTDYPKVKVFGRMAENCERYLVKGRKVAVTGRLSTGKYQRKDGETVYTTEIIASSVEFLGGEKRQEQTPPPQETQYTQEPQNTQEQEPQQMDTQDWRQEPKYSNWQEGGNYGRW